MKSFENFIDGDKIMKRRLKYYFGTLLVLGVGLVFISTRAQQDGVVVEDAAYYSTISVESPPSNLTDIYVPARVIVEYSDWTLALSLEEDGVVPVITASRRLIVEYADFVSRSVMRITPDVNHDGVMNIIDISKVARSFGSSPGHQNWNPIADLDENELINIIDVSMAANEFGKKLIENVSIDP